MSGFTINMIEDASVNWAHMEGPRAEFRGIQGEMFRKRHTRLSPGCPRVFVYLYLMLWASWGKEHDPQHLVQCLLLNGILMNIDYLLILILLGYKLEKLNYLFHEAHSLFHNFFLISLKHFLNIKFLSTKSL
jgi:hypothetical protein